MTSRKKILLLLVTCLVLSGCSLYKPYDGKIEVRQDLMGDIVQPQDTSSLGALGWREMFADPLLQQLIERGLTNNTDVRSAQLTVEQAQNDLRSVRLGNIPTLSFEPTGGLSHFDGENLWPYVVPVTATWQLNIFGQTTSKKRQQKARIAMLDDLKQAVRASLIANIANTYYTLVMLDKEMLILKETQVVWEKSLESMRILYEAGVYTSPAVYQMEASLAGVQYGIVQLQASIQTTEAALCRMLSEVPHHIERAPYGSLVLPDRLSVGVPLRLLSDRPDVRQAARKMEIAYYDTQQAHQSFYPNITITADAGWSNYNGVVNPAKFLGEAIASLTQPLFAQGKLRAKYKNAKIEQEKANLQFEQTLLNAGNEVYRYLSTYQKARESEKYIADMITSLHKAYEGTRELMNHGTNTYVEVLKAQEDLLTTQIREVENYYASVQALVNLYIALGGS